MNKNEIRGYIFLGFALLCYVTRSLGEVAYWGHSQVYYLNAHLILSGVFIIAAVICFVWAYNEIKYPAGVNKPSPGKIHYRPGQSWTEVNLFQVKLDKVGVKQNQDGYSCEAVFTAENWRTELKSGGNKMTIQPKAIAEQGAETYEIDNPESSFTVEAGKHLQFICPLKADVYTDRVLLELTVTFDDGDAIYKAEFEFYPGHYVR